MSLNIHSTVHLHLNPWPQLPSNSGLRSLCFISCCNIYLRSSIRNRSLLLASNFIISLSRSRKSPWGSECLRIASSSMFLVRTRASAPRRGCKVNSRIGTSFVVDNAARRAETNTSLDPSLKYDRSGTIILVPQPSDDPNDPLVCIFISPFRSYAANRHDRTGHYGDATSYCSSSPS